MNTLADELVDRLTERVNTLIERYKAMVCSQTGSEARRAAVVALEAYLHSLERQQLFPRRVPLLLASFEMYANSVSTLLSEFVKPQSQFSGMRVRIWTYLENRISKWYNLSHTEFNVWLTTNYWEEYKQCQRSLQQAAFSGQPCGVQLRRIISRTRFFANADQLAVYCPNSPDLGPGLITIGNELFHELDKVPPGWNLHPCVRRVLVEDANQFQGRLVVPVIRSDTATKKQALSGSWASMKNHFETYYHNSEPAQGVSDEAGVYCRYVDQRGIGHFNDAFLVEFVNSHTDRCAFGMAWDLDRTRERAGIVFLGEAPLSDMIATLNDLWAAGDRCE